MNEKKSESLDDIRKKEYIIQRNSILERLKTEALNLAVNYETNITIEINVNPKVQSVKVSIKEFL